ncbi:ABC transporter permease [Amycolatopsis rubida]|uniref:ABC transporter permease n=1 Tax=Amycolatopsis rubida TaxID=112413 RepID=A0ABX0BSJ9_9PSEU|nr:MULTISPECIES: ABC transporter permease [Amycolatopsis]MYW90815.1 ABC transporter permease [Amycolatopsis rubida]NEC55798.1 ABC transporter permease [Amycolatopsis rubida]OAP26126.1 ABC-2 type transporter [Amycolatopsis sp. M39]
MHAALNGAVFQLRLLRRSPGDLMALATTPLMTVIFLAIVHHGARPDLEANAVLAPALIALWGMSLLIAGDMIDVERENGTLEALIAAPTSLWPLLTGRIAVVTSVSLLGLAESWCVAKFAFGVTLTLGSPTVFVFALIATVFAMSGWAGVMSSLFVLSRSARIFQNSLSFPFYILGGVLVPVALLPGFLQPLSHAVFLSWSSDLLRESLLSEAPRAPLLRILVIVLLGAAGGLLGRGLLAVVLNRARTTGTISFGS